MCTDIVDWDGGSVMQEVDVKKIVREVTEEYNLPIEMEKEESCISAKAGKGRTQTENMSSGWESFSTTP